jgi:hypothetical protein
MLSMLSVERIRGKHAGIWWFLEYFGNSIDDDSPASVRLALWQHAVLY